MTIGGITTTPALLLLLLLLAAAVPSSRAGFFDKGSDVTKLRSRQQWKDVVTNSSFLWVVSFYREGCGFCVLLEPELDKAATKLKRMVRVGAVDVANTKEESELASAVSRRYGFEIKGVPSIQLILPPSLSDFSAGGSKLKPRAVEYPGERKAGAIVRHASDQQPDYIRRLGGLAAVEAWIGDASPARKVLLFTTKGTMTPLFKAVASRFFYREGFSREEQDERISATV